MPPIGQQITFLYVSDLHRSAGFYGGTLGLEMVLDQGDCRIYRVGGDAYLGICERTGDHATSGMLLTLVTDEVDDWHERLVEAGVTVEQAPATNDTYRIRHAFYRDPDGHRVEVQRFDDPDWSGTPG
ncbi:MAG: VOC family protein [Acidimicrobiia bacterium]|nr:MAG: VOC family protein [Acidimicrobiia bacterium]